MPTCEVVHDMGNGWDFLNCDREEGHEGIHRSDSYGLWWYEKAPPVEVIELPQAREIDPALSATLGRLRGGIEL
ncbi:hypothetical protein PBI_SMARTIES_12 [Microbacterium phage Smarties]|uniref:Uncharacterized protein n=1 Tax=Microbacterium phage Ariadne TaxID=2656546 RepID=A0A649VAP8_9CAUD|nr:hypothetical protein QDA10_gp012 [Microbacterium phage Ariadne]QGJ89417.1 hypothetical protein PBI_ARIADNE_12 [Microbacterium phage Ariadne]QGJ91404.1 hypothetical protein PBI_SMARTIES_12 [Microbacterium phage Smarties]